jgi:hypothetical protein
MYKFHFFIQKFDGDENRLLFCVRARQNAIMSVMSGEGEELLMTLKSQDSRNGRVKDRQRTEVSHDTRHTVPLKFNSITC